MFPFLSVYPLIVSFFSLFFALFLFFSLSSFFCFFDLEAKEEGRQRQRKKGKTEIMERRKGKKERKE